MRFNYVSFLFGRKDGTRLSTEEFISEHQDLALSPAQWKIMLENLEGQAFYFSKEFGNKKIEKITGHCKKFVFIDKLTNEMYFKPLFEIDIRVFFENLAPLVLIYDIRLAA